MPAELIERIAALEAQLAEAQTREAVAYEVAVDVVSNHGDWNETTVRDDLLLNLAMEFSDTKAALERMMAEARNAALDEAIEAITFEAEGRKAQMDAHANDAVQHERFRIGELQSRLNVKNVAALKTEPTP